MSHKGCSRSSTPFTPRAFLMTLALLFLASDCAGTDGLWQRRSRHEGERIAALARAVGAAHRKNATRNPIILIPGVGGTRLKAKLDRTSTKKTTSFQGIWLNLSDLVPEVIDCFFANMALVYDSVTKLFVAQEGVEVKVVKGLDGIRWLDDANALTRYETQYYDALATALEAAGWEEGVDLLGMGYDWRYGPTQPVMLQWWANVTQAIHQLSAANGGLAVHVVTHSMGCPVTLYMLHKHTPPETLAKIASWVAVSGPWSGAPVAAKGLVSGYNFGVPLIPNSKAREFGRTVASTPFLLPVPEEWGSYPLVITPHANYSAADYETLLVDVLDQPHSYAAWMQQRSLIGSLSGHFVAPGLPVHCAYGSGVSTLTSLVFDGDIGDNQPSSYLYQAGDGTVPQSSASLCQQWASQQSAPVNVTQFPGATHLGILQQADFLQWVMSIVAA